MQVAAQIKNKIRLAGSILAVLACFAFTIAHFCGAKPPSPAAPLTPYEQLRKDYPPGSKFTGNYRGAIQCFGFAGYAFHRLYGLNMPNSYFETSWYEFETNENVKKLGQLLRKQVTEQNVKKLMEKSQFGDIVQYGTERYPHTMLVTGYQDGVIQVYDCNYDGGCTVMDRSFSCKDLAAEIGAGSAKSGITLYRAEILYECQSQER